MDQIPGLGGGEGEAVYSPAMMRVEDQEFPAPPVELSFRNPTDTPGEARKGMREVHFPGTGALHTQVLDRYALQPGDAFHGPAVVEERESTTVIGPSCRIGVDAWRNLIVDLH